MLYNSARSTLGSRFYWTRQCANLVLPYWVNSTQQGSGLRDAEAIFPSTRPGEKLHLHFEHSFRSNLSSRFVEIDATRRILSVFPVLPSLFFCDLAGDRGRRSGWAYSAGKALANAVFLEKAESNCWTLHFGGGALTCIRSGVSCLTRMIHHGKNGNYGGRIRETSCVEIG